VLPKIIAQSTIANNKLNQYIKYLKDSHDYRRGLTSLLANHVGDSMLYMSFIINCNWLQTLGLMVYGYFLSDVLERLFGGIIFTAFMPWRDSWDSTIRDQATNQNTLAYKSNHHKLKKHFLQSGFTDVAIATILLSVTPLAHRMLPGSGSKTLLALGSTTVYKFLQVIPKIYEGSSWYLLKINQALHPNEIKSQLSLKNWGLFSSIEQSLESIAFITTVSLSNILIGFNYTTGNLPFLLFGIGGCILMLGSKLWYWLTGNKQP